MLFADSEPTPPQANPMQIRIWFLDGLYLCVQVDSWVVVAELELLIARQLGVRAPRHFGLYEALASGEERSVLPPPALLSSALLSSATATDSHCSRCFSVACFLDSCAAAFMT